MPCVVHLCSATTWRRVTTMTPMRVNRWPAFCGMLARDRYVWPTPDRARRYWRYERRLTFCKKCLVLYAFTVHEDEDGA